MNRNEVQTLQAGDLLAKLHSSPDGLSSQQANENLIKYGQNILRKQSVNPFTILLKQFTSSLIYLLIAAALIAFFLKDFSDGIVITIILLLNALLGFFQEYRSEKAIEKLAKLISRQIAVKRDGKTILLDEKLLVPGDIVIMNEGDIIPADMLLLTVDSLAVNESQLTGESVPVIKSVFKNLHNKENKDDNLVFAGSVVEKGVATGAVYATGYETQLGKIASLSQSTRKVTQYEKSLQQFSNYLMKITLFTLVIIFVAKLFISQDFIHLSTLLLFIIALAITVVPEALPVIATVTLAKGALLLAKRHVIVKRPSSLEDLGNITLLCTDKTGTLTENKMSIIEVVAKEKELFQQLAIATLSTIDTHVKKVQDPYDAAFLAFVSQEIKDQGRHYKQLEDLGFDPQARRRRVIIEDTEKNKQYLVVIGSTETLLHVAIAKEKNHYLEAIKSEEKQGIRNLAIAYKQIAYHENFNVLNNEAGLQFVGYVKLTDPLRATAKHTIELAEKLGIAIKVLTGDSAEVAAYVGKEVGLLKENESVYTGDQLSKLSPEKFKAIIVQKPIFAKVTPEQKYNIIKVLKEDFVVGYQGDGINDAPSLKLADVGIAVNTATDVAKDSAEIVLLRKDLEVIINGIRYGRTVFVNINKYIKYTMVGNFGNFFALAGLYLISVDLPLLPVQLLLTSLITDLPHIFIYSDNVNNEQVHKPQVFKIHSLMFISLLLGSLTALFEFIFFATVKIQSSLFTQTSLFLFLTFIQLIVIFSIRNTDYFWKGKHPSFLLTAATTIVFFLSVIITYVPVLSHLFSFIPLPIQELSLIILISEAYFIALDIVKVWYYKMLTAPEVR